MWAFTSPLNAKHNVPANFVRKDWLDAVGMKMPTTTDELFNVLVAFTTKDPDGNGKNDTYGMGGSKGLFNMGQAFNPFGVVYGYGDWTRADGKVVPYIVRPEMKEALAFIKRCYDAGVIDPDSFVQDGNKYWEKVRQGAYGFVDYYTNGVVNVAETAMKQTNPKVEFKAVYPPVKGPQGKQMVRTAARGNSGLWAAPVINKHPEAFARVFQWLLEGAGDTFNYGTKENVSFKSVGNFKQEVGRQSDPDFWRMNYRIMFSISSHAASDAGVQAYWQTMAENKLTTPEYPVTIKAQIEYGVADAYFIRSKIAIDKYPELESYFDELKMDIILGKKPISDFDKWVDFFYKNGGTEIVADTTRLNPK
jgi:putative aldouronate transport system substrate-binding protein